MDVVGMALLPLIWWAIVAYFVFRFLRAFERAVTAHEQIARDLARVASPSARGSGTPP